MKKSPTPPKTFALKSKFSIPPYESFGQAFSKACGVRGGALRLGVSFCKAANGTLKRAICVEVALQPRANAAQLLAALASCCLWCQRKSGKRLRYSPGNPSAKTKSSISPL
ncbi:MAG: hypothetical protein IJZ08_02985 [Clostridia bacterium]|nr:hypothetical protein [Clostridia bacterium]